MILVCTDWNKSFAKKAAESEVRLHEDAVLVAEAWAWEGHWLEGFILVSGSSYDVAQNIQATLLYNNQSPLRLSDKMRSALFTSALALLAGNVFAEDVRKQRSAR